MFTALVLVRNIQSSDHRLDFGEFTIEQIGPRFKDLRDVFSSGDVNRDDGFWKSPTRNYLPVHPDLR
jgi:hypothetical protein